MTRSTNTRDESALQFVYGRDSDYEKDTGIARVLDGLLREDELVSGEHRFFQLTHITTELTWYAVHFEMRTFVTALRSDLLDNGLQAIRRACDLLDVSAASLKAFSKNLHQQHFLKRRRHLRPDGTGFDSPGMGNLMKLAKPIWRAFAEGCSRLHIDVASLIRRATTDERLTSEEHYILELYQLLTIYDMRIMEWRQAHLRVVWKNAGGGWEQCLQGDETLRGGTEAEREARSIRGRTLDKLTRAVIRPMLPDLWRISESVFRDQTS
jgi:tryptophan 2,3-dioxygenase